MLTEAALRAGLPVGTLGAELHYFDSIGSTNQEAARLAARGNPAGTLVVADEQRRGRGRKGRPWLTPAGAGLAFSLILRPDRAQAIGPGGIGLVGALGVVEAVNALGLQPQLKWPNDVLIGGRKVSGVLVEAAWIGEELDHIVLGIGVNVRAGAVPPGEAVDFPATALEPELGRPVDRNRLLLAILHGMQRWLPRLGTPELLAAWEERLAFRGDRVLLDDGSAPVVGTLLGLTLAGGLRLARGDGRVLELEPGEYRVRPAGAGGNRAP